MRVLGFTDEVTYCDLCGKMELKGTYVIETDNGEIQHYGSTCASKITDKDISTIKAEVKKIELINEIDTQIISCKTDASKLKLYKKAMNIGIDKLEFFKKYGKCTGEDKFQYYYSFAHLTTLLPKN